MKTTSIYYLILSSFFFLLTSCKTQEEKARTSLSMTTIVTPSKSGGEPFLHVTDTGIVLLSWVEYKNDTTDVLLFSMLEKQSWSEPLTIAEGSDWFVNWADFPSIVSYENSDKNLAAHWLQKSNNGVYDYDVKIVQSSDAGNTWSTVFVPHKDEISAEHGFVSLLPYSSDKTFAVWLDGRNTKHKDTLGSDAHPHAHGGGAMTLRSALFDKAGNMSEEVELDDRVCDCCQTAAAMTEAGVIVAYRDRSEEEVRDISIVRELEGAWSAPKTIGNDNWKIAGCPVNGPALATQGHDVALAWHTMDEDGPLVKLAFSNDNGINFREEIIIDEGSPLGRVDLVWLDDSRVIISWIEEQEQVAYINIMAVSTSGSKREKFRLTETSATRQSGFPRMVKAKDQIVIAWTQVDSLTFVKSAVMKVDQFF